MRTTFLTGSLSGARTGPAPRIERFPARGSRRAGAALVIFPGGGYAGLLPPGVAGSPTRPRPVAPQGGRVFPLARRVDEVADRAPAAYLQIMNRARHAAATIGRILLFTSLMAVVLVLAFVAGGPALVISIFSAVVILVPLATAPRAPAPAFVGVRRRRFLSRAPPTF